MKIDQPRINIRRAALIFVAGIITASCSEKSPDREKDVNASEAPREVVRESEVETAEGGDEPQARAAATDCPGCPAGGTSVLAFRGVQTDAVSCSDDTCTVVVTIRAVFNPGSGETVAGGLTAWIPPEQRNGYLSGHTPSGEQVYRVRITYKRRGAAWRAVEFDRAPVE